MTDQTTTAPAEAADVFEVIGMTRSMRRLKTDPVPGELIRQILEAGTCAPSGGNMQRWRFLVIRDPQVKQTVGALYRRIHPVTTARTVSPAVVLAHNGCRTGSVSMAFSASVSERPR